MKQPETIYANLPEYMEVKLDFSVYTDGYAKFAFIQIMQLNSTC